MFVTVKFIYKLYGNTTKRRKHEFVTIQYVLEYLIAREYHVIHNAHIVCKDIKTISISNKTHKLENLNHGIMKTEQISKWCRY